MGILTSLMVRPIFVIGVVFVIVMAIAGLYFLPVHEVTVNVINKGLLVEQAGVTIEGEDYTGTDVDGNVITNLPPGTYDITVLCYGSQQTKTITISTFDLTTDVDFVFDVYISG